MIMRPTSQLRKTIFDPLAWYLSRKELHALMNRIEGSDVHDIIQATQQYTGRGHYASIRSVQALSEISSLLRKVLELRPKVVVEIGTYKGGTLFMWSRIEPSPEKIVSIDLPGGRYGGGYNRNRRKLYREFVADRPGTEMTLFQCDSHSSATLKRLREILDGSPVDFLYIDGDHSYDGAKQDFEMYSPLVRTGGIVAFHDIVTTADGCGVDRLWDELKKSYPHEEYTDGTRGKKGIGVLQVP
jgi:cephalosporin hydroxylase